MTRPGFDPVNPQTWGLVLNLDEVALIYGRNREAVRHSLKPSAGVPSIPKPFSRKPAMWRKADIERHVLGARKVSA